MENLALRLAYFDFFVTLPVLLLLLLHFFSTIYEQFQDEDIHPNADANGPHN